jgi:hypothetical protein
MHDGALLSFGSCKRIAARLSTLPIGKSPGLGVSTIVSPLELAFSGWVNCAVFGAQNCEFQNCIFSTSTMPSSVTWYLFPSLVSVHASGSPSGERHHFPSQSLRGWPARVILRNGPESSARSISALIVMRDSSDPNGKSPGLSVISIGFLQVRVCSAKLRSRCAVSMAEPAFRASIPHLRYSRFRSAL